MCAWCLPITDQLSSQSQISLVLDFSSIGWRRKSRVLFYSESPSCVTVRWINLNGPDGLNFKRFAIKYRTPSSCHWWYTCNAQATEIWFAWRTHFTCVSGLRMESIYVSVNKAKVRQKSRSKSRLSLFRLDSSISLKAGPMPLNCGDSFPNLEKVDDNEDLVNPERACSNIFCGNCTLITVKDIDSTNIWDELNHRLIIRNYGPTMPNIFCMRFWMY